MLNKFKNNYVVTSTLPPEFGGRTKSLLQRTKNLSQEFKMNFTLITTNYHPNYYKIYENYYKNKFINEDTNFINIYDFFAERKYNKKKFIQHSKDIKGFDYFQVKQDEIYRYFKDGYYERYRSYDKKTGILKFEDIMDIYTRKRKERLEYNDFGFCHKKIVYKRNSTNPLQEIFYNDKEEVYLIKDFNGSDDSKLVRIYLKYNKGMLMFEEEKSFFKFAFDQIIQPGGITFCDARLLDMPLIESIANTKKYFVLHSSHYLDSSIRNSYKYLLNNINKADKIIVLTKEQAKDLMELGLDSEKIAVIPHSMKDKVEPLHEKNRSYEKFVYLGRLTGEKQVDHIIKAFKNVVERKPSYSLEIYGEGEKREELDKLIDELNLKNSVKLMGKTDDIEGVFRTSNASVITSEFEGFGLVIMESLFYECPVISYNFKYGPKDLITNEKNGYIVEKNNINLLSEVMLKVINNPLKEAKLSQEFYLSANLEKWQKLLGN